MNQNKKPLALIVDDEPDICELLKMTLAGMGVDCCEANTYEQAKTLLMQQKFSLCLTDMRLPDGDGINLVKHIQVHCPQTPVAVITAFGNVEGAVNSLKAGAYDYVSKPVDLKMLRALVSRALKLSPIYDGNAATSDAQQSKKSNSQLLGNAKSILDLRNTVNKLARSQAPVLIHGESGTGKELVARLIHEQGPREDKPFVPVNCGAIPRELMESEFFGHKKGSFSGAVADKEGLFQAADGGTLFLDEIAELPMDMQVKLLRAIQERAVRPIGEQRELTVDARIVSATHKDLNVLVKNGEFRQDLFYRINVIEVKVPSLRERAQDIVLLAGHIVDKLHCDSETDKPSVEPDALSALTRYSFPGNVRELENILERALTLCDGKQITVADLQLPTDNFEEALHTHDESLPEDVSLISYMDNIEKNVIMEALEKHRWNKTQAAKALGISFRALRYRLEKLGL